MPLSPDQQDKTHPGVLGTLIGIHFPLDNVYSSGPCINTAFLSLCSLPVAQMRSSKQVSPSAHPMGKIRVPPSKGPLPWNTAGFRASMPLSWTRGTREFPNNDKLNGVCVFFLDISARLPLHHSQYCRGFVRDAHHARQVAIFCPKWILWAYMVSLTLHAATNSRSHTSDAAVTGNDDCGNS